MLTELKNKAFCVLAVLKTNEMEKPVFISKNEMKKGGRETMDTHVSKDKNMCVVRCQDNNMVNIASTFLGISHKDKIKRWNIKEKKYIEVDRLETIKFYNDYMEGVEIMDRSKPSDGQQEICLTSVPESLYLTSKY